MRPTKILSYDNLFSVYRHSRDYGNNPSSVGIDKCSAKTFKANHQHNISQLAKDIRSGSYHQKSLRLALIPKGTNSHRPVCIPTIRDRIVQRAINRYLMGPTVKLGMSQQVTYGFLKGYGSANDAIKMAITKRTKKGFIVKTDISKFFDEIDRNELVERLNSIRMSPSLIPPLIEVIRSEVKIKSPTEIERFKESGLKKNRGLRQGMPLSPLLASIFLRDFDKAIVKQNCSFLRYADDLIIFGKDKAEATRGFEVVRDELNQLGLEVPALGNEKSELREPRQSVEYLGQEIVYNQKTDSYHTRIPQNSIERILNVVAEMDLAKSIYEKETLGSVFRKLDSRSSSYNAYFSEASNLGVFQKRVSDEVRKTKKKIFVDLFGPAALKLKPNEKRFLGWD
jgi:retron-type reverse transcriptase